MIIDKYLLNNRIRIPIVLTLNVLLLLPIILIITLNDYSNDESDNYIIYDLVFMVYYIKSICIFCITELVKLIDDVELDEDIREQQLKIILAFIRMEFINIINHIVVLLFFIAYIIADTSDVDEETMRNVIGVIMMLDLVFLGLVVVLYICYRIIGVFKQLPQEIKNTKNNVKKLDDETPVE